MRLRTIIMSLSILALLAITLGGVYYSYSLRESAFAVARRRGEARIDMLDSQISSFLMVNLKPVRALAGIKEIQRALENPGVHTFDAANQVLDQFQRALDVDVCYLMDWGGGTVASSNRNQPDSFLNQNFSFRPYFKRALKGYSAKYLALGTTSKKRGAYYSHPVYSQDGRGPLGVIVIKAPIRVMEKELLRPSHGITLLTGPHGVIFSSSRKDWLYKTLWNISPAERKALAESRQFGKGPWEWTGLARQGADEAQDRSGNSYLLYSKEIEDFKGWRVCCLQRVKDVSPGVLGPLVRTTGSLVMALCIFAGLAVYFLYRKASQEILRRKNAEQELRQSEKRYRDLYHHTPAMLMSISPDKRLLRVSDYWAKTLGYKSEEVVGTKLSAYLSPGSRSRAENLVLAEAFDKGFSRDDSLKFAKKDGRQIDVLMSAVGEGDSGGKADRCLAVLVDITKRKKAEEELRQAKEMLSHYSRDLERQVRERTRELTGFLQHTPAVVYLKDRDGRYILVNSRHEQVFGVVNQQIRGKTVFDVFSPEVAEEFRQKELAVLKEKRSFRAEEYFIIGGQKRSFLSVRFPLLDENGLVTRICGISVDITDIKKAQDQLRRLSGAILTSQEKERAAISRELHDELGQVLTALKMDAVWLRRNLESKDQKTLERARNMCELIDTTIRDVRNISTRLRPTVLDDLGLIDALEWHTTDFEERFGVACVYTHFDVPDLDEYLSIAVYRVAQEALTNVARHSKATHVEVSLRAEDGRIILDVKDNGVGFDHDEVQGLGGIGLGGMHERANLAGGRLDIHSRPGQGTYIRLSLPMQGEAEAVLDKGIIG